MATELKPCPFCGSEAVQLYSINTGTSIYGCFTPCCMGNAQNHLYKFGTVKEAIAAWNRRTDDGK